MPRAETPALLPALLVAACSISGPPGAAAGPATGALAPGFPVWNQAYQETYEPDSIPRILAEARGAYVLLDPFAEAPGGGWAATVAAIQANGNEVGAYISVGTGEDWREDFAALRPYLVTRPWDEWAGEYFVTDTAGALPLMKARIDRIADWGFDWVEFDNMDWALSDDVQADYGVTTTSPEGIAYDRALCDHAHARGLRCMAKNTVEGVNALFDGALYESYSDDMGWWDEAGAIAFAQSGKPVIIVHYDETDCARVEADYRARYGATLSFLCETEAANGYVH